MLIPTGRGGGRGPQAGLRPGSALALDRELCYGQPWPSTASRLGDRGEVADRDGTDVQGRLRDIGALEGPVTGYGSSESWVDGNRAPSRMRNASIVTRPPDALCSIGPTAKLPFQGRRLGSANELLMNSFIWDSLS